VQRQLDEAGTALEGASGASERLARSLRETAARYSFAEEGAARASQALAGVLGYGVGYLLPAIALVALQGVSVLAVGLLAGYAAAPEPARKAFVHGLVGWLRESRALLSDPHVVRLVRLSVMSVDDFGAGLARLPPAVTRVLGDDGFGVIGLDTSAMLFIGAAAGLGALTETAVSVRPGTVSAVSSRPAGFEDRVERIPTGGSRIRIDRVSEPERPDRFEVYLGGTTDFSLLAGDDPFDMTSNVTAIAGGSAGSYRAAVQAMALAGIEPDSVVVLTGYSQGGLIAAELAASGDYNTAGLYTLGAPAGQVGVPATVPYLAIEHTEDLVPATGGTFATSRPVLVRRSLFDGHPPEGDAVFPAHELSRYRETAALLDRSADPEVTAVLRAIGGPPSVAATVTSTLYLARRD
jgi:hypothetical protein